jgi:hypothetical protein
MSDYLNSIVLRSLNLATVVQPRVPQLFEEAPAPLSDTPQQTTIISNASDLRDEVSQVSATPPSQQNAAQHSTIILETAKTSGEIHPQPQPLTVPSLSPTPQVSEVAPASLISSAAPDISQPTDTPVPPPNLKTQTPADAEYAASTIRPAEGTQRQQQHLLRPAAPATTTKPHLSQPMSPAFVPNVSAAAQSMPIRISIGRVDVRAIMPAGPAKATVATRAKPALSLENYLKQREEGKR